MDADSATRVLQRSSPAEAEEAIHRLAGAHVNLGGPSAVITTVRGVPDHPAAFRLSDTARRRLAHRLAPLHTPEGREVLVLGWSRTRGRVSSTEAADLTGLSKVSASKLLIALADARQLQGSRPERVGRGFFYTPFSPGQRSTPP